MIDQIKNSLWTEAYRPQSLDEYVGNDSLKDRIAGYIAEGDVPHLLLYGKQGTGKTTLARLIVKSIECDYMVINASDENNVDTVRNKIKNFASSQGFKPFKIVILDECDYLTANAQAILRNLMETFSQHCRFILTCNYIERIIEPIQSRCQDEQIFPPSKKEVCIQLATILKKESVTFEPKDIVKIVDASYPDIRKCINVAQRQSKSGELVLDDDSILDSDFKAKLIDLLKGKLGGKDTFMAIRKLIADNRVRDFSDTYRMLFDKVEEYAPAKVTTCILILAESQYQDALVIDKEISFASCIIKLLSEIKK